MGGIKKLRVLLTNMHLSIIPLIQQTINQQNKQTNNNNLSSINVMI